MARSNMLEHPDITSALETGYPCGIDHARYHCAQCGAAIRDDDPYYLIGDTILCPECVEEAKRYA